MAAPHHVVLSLQALLRVVAQKAERDHVAQQLQTQEEEARIHQSREMAKFHFELKERYVRSTANS